MKIISHPLCTHKSSGWQLLKTDEMCVSSLYLKLEFISWKRNNDEVLSSGNGGNQVLDFLTMWFKRKMKVGS